MAKRNLNKDRYSNNNNNNNTYYYIKYYVLHDVKTGENFRRHCAARRLRRIYYKRSVARQELKPHVSPGTPRYTNNITYCSVNEIWRVTWKLKEII